MMTLAALPNRRPLPCSLTCSQLLSCKSVRCARTGVAAKARGEAGRWSLSTITGKSRWITAAALMRILPTGCSVWMAQTSLLCADHSQPPLWREIPEHGSNQPKRRHVADQVTYLVSVMYGLYCHDAGVHDA